LSDSDRPFSDSDRPLRDSDRALIGTVFDPTSPIERPVTPIGRPWAVRTQREDHAAAEVAEALLAEAVERGGAAAALAPLVAGLLEDAEAEHLPAEVPLVEGLGEDGLVDALQLAERELGRQELEGDRRVLGLVAQALERVVDDAAVIEGQRRKLVDRMPGDRGRVGAGLGREPLGVDER